MAFRSEILIKLDKKGRVLLPAAFQRRFRPARVDGIADPETRALLADLLDQADAEA